METSQKQSQILPNTIYPKSILGERIDLENLPVEDSEVLEDNLPVTEREEELRTFMNPSNKAFKKEEEEEENNKSQVSDLPVSGNS